MATTHPPAVRNVLADAVVDRIDLGSGNGVLVFQDAASVTVATLTFSKPAFGAAAGGVATAAAITPDSSAVGGTITKAEARDSAGVVAFLCSVTLGGGGGDITLSSVVVTPGQPVSLTSLTYTAPL